MIVNRDSLSAIFRVLKADFTKSLETAIVLWDKLATMVPSVTAQTDYVWLSNFPQMREWMGEKVVKQLSGSSYSIRNKSYEATIEVLRDDIEDDNLGIYATQAQGVGVAARQWPDSLVFPLLKAGFSSLCYDGQYFFDVDHPVAGVSVSNYGGGSGAPWFLLDTTKPLKPLLFQQRKAPTFVQQTNPESDNVFMEGKFRFGVEARGNAGYGLWQLAYASKQALDATSFAAALQAMQELKNDEGVPLNVTPSILVVPPSLRSAALQLIEVQKLANGADNPNYKAVEVLVAPRLA